MSRNFTISSRMSVIIRRVELILSLFLLGTIMIFTTFDGVPNVIPEFDIVRGLLFFAVFFVAPLALAIVGLLTTIVGRISIGSIITGVISLSLVFIIVTAITTLFTSGGDGGVYFGHLFAYAVALILSITALVRPPLDRLFSTIFEHPGLIQLES